MATIDGKIITTNSLPANRILDPTDIQPTQLAQRTNQRYQIPFHAWRIWDAFETLLGATPTSDDDLALVGGTFGTNPPSIQTGDVKTVTKTRYARACIALPFLFDDAATVLLRTHAGMKTTIADGSATVDFEVYESDLEDGLDGSPTDLCTTAAQSINSTSFADYDFTLTSTNLVKGSVLDVRVTIATVDTATGTAVIGVLGNVELLIDTQ